MWVDSGGLVDQATATVEVGENQFCETSCRQPARSVEAKGRTEDEGYRHHGVSHRDSASSIFIISMQLTCHRFS